MIDVEREHSAAAYGGGSDAGATQTRARRDGDGTLTLSVADTGAGLREGAPPGTGLANLRERLAMFYGAAARLEIAENVPCGVVVTVHCPVEADS